jgi:hypothetical protein
MKKKPNDIAFQNLHTSSIECLTKREYFAAMALQGLLTNNNKDNVYFVISAVEFADDLIEELSKTKTNEKK